MKEDASIFEWRNYETVTCPKCESGNVARIFYGRPIMSSEYKEALDNGIVALGTCIISEDFPVYQCNDCREQWGRLEDDEYMKVFFEMVKRKKRKTKRKNK